MTWVYDVRKKTFERDGAIQFAGQYAGAPGFKDNPDQECLIDRGALPRGKYRIGRPITKHRSAGRYVLPLTPYAENKMCGRAGFLIHGDNGAGTASKGCIVLDPRFRKLIAESGDRELLVK